MARESLREVERYMRRYSDEAAQGWVRRIRRAVRNIPPASRRHRVVPEVGDDLIRELFVGNYRVWYRVRDSESVVEILVVFHGSRRVPG